jgi:hypothetical protein
MTAEAGDLRSASLDAYLARRVSQGFRVETRTGAQAVIVRRHRLYFALHWFAPGAAEQRYVVSVDQHGEVDTLEAEPVRW